jgi:bifunctional DNase/RNase
LTHDLLQSVISTLGASVDYIVVSGLKEDTFYARLALSVDGVKLDIDSRPSDALALAVRVGAPIYAEESVLEKAGIILEEETGKSLTEGKSEGKVDEQELKGLSAYKDFINTLDLEDFKKRQS